MPTSESCEAGGVWPCFILANKPIRNKPEVCAGQLYYISE